LNLNLNFGDEESVNVGWIGWWRGFEIGLVGGRRHVDSDVVVVLKKLHHDVVLETTSPLVEGGGGGIDEATKTRVNMDGAWY
jgi:hypothetical protein